MATILLCLDYAEKQTGMNILMVFGSEYYGMHFPWQ